MDAVLYYLEARAPFHIGARGVGIEATSVYIPTDTLFSAICHMLRQEYGAATLTEFLRTYDTQHPPMLLTSAFPYALDRTETEVENWQQPKPFDPKKTVRFYPRPLLAPPNLQVAPQDRKHVKKIAWLSTTIFQDWVTGVDLEPHTRPFCLEQGKRLWLSSAERDRIAGWRNPENDQIQLWVADDVPRVTVDRRSSASAVYQAGRVWFQPGGGFWMMVRWGADWQARGEQALLALGDGGIGGERSVGHGQFVLHGPYDSDPLAAPAPGESFVSLSLYHPKQSEGAQMVEGTGLAYHFELRRGWMSSPDQTQAQDGQVYQGRALRRKAVRMFVEGSVLYYPSDITLLGNLADVTPEQFLEHRVYRYGIAWPVAYQAKESTP